LVCLGTRKSTIRTSYLLIVCHRPVEYIATSGPAFLKKGFHSGCIDIGSYRDDATGGCDLRVLVSDSHGRGFLVDARQHEKDVRWRKPAVRLLEYTLTFGLGFGAFLLLRLEYFHHLSSNTYRVKGGPDARMVLNLLLLRTPAVDRLLALVGSVTFRPTLWVLIIPTATTCCLLAKRAFNREHGVLLAFLVASLAGYLLLPDDYMGEFRSATPFYVLFYLYAVILLSGFLTIVPKPVKQRLVLSRWLAAIAAMGFLGLSLLQVVRTAKFSMGPTVPLAEISELFGERYNRCADIVGVSHGSILLPDLGGTLLRSRLRRFDLAGLCDRTVAITLG
jgi:hypothetical protein